jgi:hypothetical protein
MQAQFKRDEFAGTARSGGVGDNATVSTGDFSYHDVDSDSSISVQQEVGDGLGRPPNIDDIDLTQQAAQDNDWQIVYGSRQEARQARRDATNGSVSHQSITNARAAPSAGNGDSS